MENIELKQSLITIAVDLIKQSDLVGKIDELETIEKLTELSTSLNATIQEYEGSLLDV